MAKTAKKVALYEDSIPDEIKIEFKKVMDTEAVLMEYAAIKTDADKIAWVDKYGVGLLCVVRSVKVQTGYASEPDLPKSTDKEYAWFFHNDKQMTSVKRGIARIKTALAGKPMAIENAFTWALSPQGSSHWSTVCNSTKKIDGATRELLETMVAIAEREGLLDGKDE